MPTLPPAARKILIRVLRPRRVRSTGAGKALEIAIFKPDRLGDFILASGTIRHARETFGPEKCAIIVADFVVDLARQLFGDSLIIGVPFAHNDLLRGVVPALWKARPLLSGLHFNKVACLRHQRTIYEELLLGRMPGDESFGIQNSLDCMLPSDHGVYEHRFTRSAPYPPHAPPGLSREIEANRMVLSMALGREVPSESVLPSLSFPPAGEKLDDTIIISPFGSTDIRTYPLPKLVAVLRAIQQQRPVRFIACSSANDGARLSELMRLAEHAGVRDISIRNPPSFSNFCSLVASARGVIAVETSTAHLATALDKPAVIIIGGGQYGEFGPWRRSSRQVWLTHEIPCFGCHWNCIHPEPFCITQVTPEAIASAMIERI